MTTTDHNNIVPDTPAELLNTGEPPATNVIEALRRVIRDLPAIGKEGTGPSSQGGYKYRGIEQITRHAAPLFAKHGLVMAPNAIVWRPTRELNVGGKPSTDESLLVTYRVYGPGGVDDFIEVQTPGIGRDNSDKGSNKAMTAAFKYALTQMLTIADAKDDSDAVSLEADPPHDPDDVLPPPAMMDRIRELCRTLRERGNEVTETNDEGEVRVLGVKITTRNEAGKLWPALTESEAGTLIARLNTMLADALLADGDSPATPASRPAETPGEESPPPPTPGPETATERVETERERVAREQLLAVSQKPTGAEAKGMISGKPADATEAKFTEHVNGLGFTAVVEQLNGLGLSIEGQPQAVRRRLRDHLVAQSARAHAGEA